MTETQHLKLEWYASPLSGEVNQLRFPNTDDGLAGMVVNYASTADSTWSLGEASLAWSSLGKGDYRSPGVRVAEAGVLDFTYRSHRLVSGVLPLDGLPQAAAEPETQTLEILLCDDVAQLECRLLFTTFPESGVVTRRTVLRNLGPGPRVCTQLASFLADLYVGPADLITLDGRWLGEAQAHRSPVGEAQLVNASLTGSSSTEHNPGILLVGAETTESAGWCYGFNLVYSGSHRTTVQRSMAGTVRILGGLHPDDFEWSLEPGAEFATPEAVLCFSDVGLGDLSRRMHKFVNDCIVPAHWRRVERPVVLNSWEAVYFDFDAESLLEVAEAGASLGAEVFVLDDGWFGQRRDDRRALGDWQVNQDKLPGGLTRLGERLSELGLKLGLWFEPEAVNPDSDLYREHPDWAIAASGRVPSQGRHELLLDLTRGEVRDYIVEAVTDVLDSVEVSFVKWDMNRLISDADQAGFTHRYLLGLYDVLGRIFGPRPEILLETCSSGGNRFDLGLLTFGPQIWASDCTDPVERLSIQEGLSLLYPRSAISAHVSVSPNHQTGRCSPLAFRFGVSATHNLGLELDPRQLSAADSEELRRGVEWYKANRTALQFGDHWRLPASPGTFNLALGQGSELTVGRFTCFVPPRSPRSSFVAPVTEDEAHLVSRELVAEAKPVEFPGRALRHGVPQPGRISSQTAELYRVWRADRG